MLKEKMNFDEKTENFLYITSKYLPRISSFLQFWGKNMYIFENEKEFLFELDIYDLEIEELVMLYKYNTNSYLCETEMMNIINHFFVPVLFYNYSIASYRRTWHQEMEEFVKHN